MGKIFVKVPVWNIESETGYKPMTTFWQDFSIADAFGVAAVEDTFKRAFNEWKGNYKYLTELVMVLNHKIAQWCMRETCLLQNSITMRGTLPITMRSTTCKVTS